MCDDKENSPNPILVEPKYTSSSIAARKNSNGKRDHQCEWTEATVNKIRNCGSEYERTVSGQLATDAPNNSLVDDLFVLRKITKCQLKILQMIEKIEIKLNRFQKLKRSHNRTHQQQQMLNESATKIIDLNTHHANLSTEKVLAALLHVHEHFFATLSSYHKYFDNLDLLRGYLADLYQHVRCAIKLFFRYCPGETHAAQVLLDKLKHTPVGITKLDVYPTEKELSTRNKLSMYASNQNPNRKCVQKLTKSMPPPLPRPDNVHRKARNDTVETNYDKTNKNADIGIVKSDWHVAVQPSKESPLLEHDLKLLHDTFVSKKELWGLLQTLKVALLSYNSKHTSGMRPSDETINNMNKQCSDQLNEHRRPAIRNICNVEKSIQYAKNVKLIEIEANDGVATPRYPAVPSTALDIVQRRMHLEPSSTNSLYVNEQFVEPWKVVTSIANSIFLDQMMRVVHGRD